MCAGTWRGLMVTGADPISKLKILAGWMSLWIWRAFWIKTHALFSTPHLHRLHLPPPLICLQRQPNKPTGHVGGVGALPKLCSAWSICAVSSCKKEETAKKSGNKGPTWFPKENINRARDASWLQMFPTCHLYRLWERLLIWLRQHVSDNQSWAFITCKRFLMLCEKEWS